MKKLIYLSAVLPFLISCGGGGTDAEKELKSYKLKPLKDKIYFGAFCDFGGTEDKVSLAKIEEFEKLANKKIAWAVFSNNWYNGIKYPKKSIETIYRSGAAAYVRFMPRSNESEGEPEKFFTLQKIIDGKFDNELKEWAKAAKNANIPILADFAVEPNGNWFGWSGVFNGGGRKDGYGDKNYPDGPERYRDAYRHIIDIFRSEGVKNVTWFFHFNYQSFPNKEWNSPKYYYPGDNYIDWVGFSLYGAQQSSEEWDDLKFSTQFNSGLKNLQDLHTKKPVALLEFGVTDNHPQGSKALWYKDAFDTILNNRFVKFKAVSIWHENWENEDGTQSLLRIDSSKESLKEFRKQISNPVFSAKTEF